MTVDKHLRKHLKARAKFGSNKYGKELLPFNGRNPLRDKREELLDALVYNEQDLMEREQLGREIEEAYNLLYNFRQTNEIENADLDKAIAALGKMVVKLEADTERIEPKTDASCDDATIRTQPLTPPWLNDTTTIFGPDAPPIERMRDEALRAFFIKAEENRCLPLGPVMESIRRDGPIGTRDLLEIAEKHPAMERLEKMECDCCGKCVQ